MIQGKDLRVGNLVNFNNEIRTIYTISHRNQFDGKNDRVQLNHKSNICLVDPDADNHYSDSDLNGIPITKEWLFKFGFTDDTPEYCKDNSNSYWQGRYNYVFMGKCAEAKYFRIYRNPETDWNKKDIRGYKLGEWMYYACQYWVVSIEYVHQLQNTFFILTGEELNLDVS